jgi:hypothetical protein
MEKKIELALRIVMGEAWSNDFFEANEDKYEEK